MDVPLVLSHRTAWLFYHAPHRHEVLASGEDFAINELGLPSRRVAERLQRFLRACGIPGCDLETIDILLAMDFMRTDSKPFRPHVLGAIVSAGDVHELVPGVCIVREELCFMQASTWMSRLELIEYGYELCGRYEVPLSRPGNRPDSYIELTQPVTTRDEIRAYLVGRAGLRGSRKAADALVRVRDGARSPAECAVAMLVNLDKKDGGLGSRSIQLNYRIEVPPAVRPLTTSSHFEVDIYVPRLRAGVEYDGEVHADARQRARDAERLSALAAMGVHVDVVTRRQLAEQLPLHRAMSAVARNLKIRLEPTWRFQKAQDGLRRFVIRTWPSQSWQSQAG